MRDEEDSPLVITLSYNDDRFSRICIQFIRPFRLKVVLYNRVKAIKESDHEHCQSINH